MNRAWFALVSVLAFGFYVLPAANGQTVGPAGVLERTYKAQAQSGDGYLSVEPQSINVFQMPVDQPSAGLVIVPTFDASITGNPNAAAIEAAINRAIAILEAQFSDPVTVNIYFRYSGVSVNGQPLGNGNLAQSVFPIFPIAWNTYKQSLMTDAKTSADATAIAGLPGTPLTANVIVSSANGRTLGLNTPGTMTSTGGVSGGTYDGIVTLNSTQPYSFVRPPGNSYDAVRAAQHEMDEVLGLGSFINSGLTDVEPQDLFSWSSRGTRNITSGGSRYFSIDGGATNLVGFNQNPGGDFGDWLSMPCPQANPLVQNAFSCIAQSSDVTATSPEGINLDIIGFDPGTAPSGRAAFDYDADGKSDISVFRPSTGAWYLLRSTAGLFGTGFGLSIDKIVPADYDGDGRADIAVYRPTIGTWFITSSATGGISYNVFGVAEDLPVPADYDGDGKADIAVFRPSNGTWYRKNSGNGMFISVQFGAVGDKPVVGDFDGDGKADIAVYRPSTGAWYRINSSNGTVAGEQFGISTDVVTPADFNGDGKTDVAVYRPSLGYWFIRNAAGVVTVQPFGISTDIPAAGDFDGDGKADICVFRPTDGNWYRMNSSNGSISATQFGANGDRPTQTAYRY